VIRGLSIRIVVVPPNACGRGSGPTRFGGVVTGHELIDIAHRIDSVLTTV
jgi:hypothetical protein